MSVSIILTVNNRSPEVSEQVAKSLALPGNEADELIVVLDRPTPEALHGATKAYTDCKHTMRFVDIGGEPGWKGPAKAWNAGFKAATSDLLYCISSEVVQEKDNVKRAVELCTNSVGGAPDARIVKYDTVVFGACNNSVADNLVVGAEPGVLVNSKMARPLGFIVCMPAKAVKAIGGFDENFMAGFWYDDDDFFYRLWKHGLDFLFTDSIHGIHLHHERPDLETPEGQAGIKKNQEYMAWKHGKYHVWGDLPKTTTCDYKAGLTKWEHP